MKSGGYSLMGLLSKAVFILYNYVYLMVLSHYYTNWVHKHEKMPHILSSYVIFFGPWAFLYLFIVNVAYMEIYVGRFPTLEKYKISEGPWPWEKEGFFTPQHIGQLKRALFSLLVIMPILTVLMVFVSTTDTSIEGLPSLGYHLFTFAFSLFVEDFVFYFFHKFLHIDSIYKRFHKQHHHSQPIVVLATLDNHPLETFLSGLTPFLGGFILGRSMHFVSLMVYTTTRFWESYEAHSGYQFPFSIFDVSEEKVNSQYHNFHHSHNLGNYSMTLKFWDRYFGTIRNYENFLLVKEKKLA